MNRRSFLKLGALFAAAMAVETSPALKAAAKVLELDNTQVLLYLIRNHKGQWKVKGTKYVDVPKTRINQNLYDISTFRFLGTVENHVANERKLELWKEYNCSGNMGFKLDVSRSTRYGKRTGNINKEKTGFLSFVGSCTSLQMQSQNGKKGGKKTKESGKLKENLAKATIAARAVESYKKAILKSAENRIIKRNNKIMNIYNQLPYEFSGKDVKDILIINNINPNFNWNIIKDNSLCFKFYNGKNGSNKDVPIYRKLI